MAAPAFVFENQQNENVDDSNKQSTAVVVRNEPNLRRCVISSAKLVWTLTLCPVSLSTPGASSCKKNGDGPRSSARKAITTKRS